MTQKRITLAALETKFAGSLKWPGGSQWVDCEHLAWMLRELRQLTDLRERVEHALTPGCIRRFDPHTYQPDQFR